MNGLFALDRLVAGRGGDGLHPRLRALLEQRLHIEAAFESVVELDRYRAVPVQQAGPHPAAGKPTAAATPHDAVAHFSSRADRPRITVRTATQTSK